MVSDTPRPLLDHLLELRRRLIYALVSYLLAFVLCYHYSEQIFAFLVKPLAELLHSKGVSMGQRRLIYTGLTEAFLTYVKVAAFSAGFLSFPILASQLWLFIAPGLFRQERKVFTPLLMATPLLFLMGAAFAYYLVFPTAYGFFLSFESTGLQGTLPLQLEAKVNEYLSFVMRLVFAFGVSFELPILLTLLANIGIVRSAMLVEKWRIAVVAIFALSAIVTPPDIISMIALAVPLMALYALSIFMVRLVETKASKSEWDGRETEEESVC